MHGQQNIKILRDVIYVLLFEDELLKQYFAVIRSV